MLYTTLAVMAERQEAVSRRIEGFVPFWISTFSYIFFQTPL